MHYLCIFCGLFSTVHLYYWVYRQIRNMQNAHFTLVRYDFTGVFIFTSRAAAESTVGVGGGGGGGEGRFAFLRLNVYKSISKPDIFWTA